MIVMDDPREAKDKTEMSDKATPYISNRPIWVHTPLNSWPPLTLAALPHRVRPWRHEAFLHTSPVVLC